MKCDKCGITIPELPEDATYEEMLCDRCYEEYPSNLKHTPGPWYTARKNTVGDGSVFCEPTNNVIANCIWAKDEDELRANGRLIAAAPDLLEACKAAASDLSGGSLYPEFHQGAEGPLRVLRHAIQTAEGG